MLSATLGGSGKGEAWHCCGGYNRLFLTRASFDDVINSDSAATGGIDGAIAAVQDRIKAVRVSLPLNLSVCWHFRSNGGLTLAVVTG